MQTTVTSYANEHHRSLNDPEGFWAEQAAGIPWVSPPTQILSTEGDEPDILHRWFADGVLNTCYAAVDYHVANGRADQVALIHDSPTTNTISRFTYRQVRNEVAHLAGALRAQGVEKGDTVVIYMPMIPETAFAMLACARLGAIHSVVFGGFAPHELAVRIDDARPRVLICASGGIE